MAEVILFAGPSLAGAHSARLARAGVRLQPPARRDDIARLLQRGVPPGVIVLADGVFQVAPAVSHAELCGALDAGWQVWGVASLGAIRACELSQQGMRGYGWVYQAFAGAMQLDDDEACVLHFPEPPWFQVTEALVNLRSALQRRGPRFGISAQAGDAVVAELRQRWFGHRSPELMAELLRRESGASDGQIEAFMAWLAAHPVKNLDLACLLRQRPWLPASAAPGPGPRTG